MSVTADEVVLTFHAADAQGLAITDLKLEELRLLDANKPPRKMLNFEALRDLPIRAGILMDTSESMRKDLAVNREIAARYAQSLLRQQTDQAFVTEFGRLPTPVQSWTSDPAALVSAIHTVSVRNEGSLRGTALFDTLFRTCHYQFGEATHVSHGDFIMLFSDGEDNGSTTALKDVVDMCQRSGTAIYAFRPESVTSFGDSGAGTLGELTAQTGGRVFHSHGSVAEIRDDLSMIEGEQRNQYRLVYRPAELKHDGSFHSIALLTPDRVKTLGIRSGYYAPAR